MGFKGKTITLALLLVAALPLAAQNGEQRDSLVRLIKAKTLELIEKGGRAYRKSVDATFLHNGTYLICDSALWNVEDKVINAEGHVKVIQEGTILTSDKMDYLIDEDLVQCRGGVVQLEDDKRNTLRTHYLDYNTRDSIAFFSRGASMRDSEGQIIESDDGSYDAKAQVFTFKGNVNMYTDSIFVRTSLLDYESAVNRANFLAPIDFWKDGNMLSARSGWYLRPEETFFFTGHVHATSEEQEAWCDSLFYYRVPNDLLMLGAAQVQDTTRDVAALANRIYYCDTLSQITMSRDAAVALMTTEEEALKDSLGNPTGRVREHRDTLYMGADLMIYRTIPFCLVDPGDTLAAHTRKADMLTDPVLEYRQKAAKAAAEAAAKAAQEAAEREGRPAPGAAVPGGPETVAAPAQEPDEGPARPAEAALEAPAESLVAPIDTLVAVSDSLAEGGSVKNGQNRQTPPAFGEGGLSKSAENDRAHTPVAREDSANAADSTPGSDAPEAHVAPAESPNAPADSLLAPADTITTPVDTIPAPLDSTKIGFLDARGNVRIFRHDIQIRCDSLRYNDLDSIARLYIDPIVWNDGNRQYSADSLFAMVVGNSVDRVALENNAFVITQESYTLFDQIKATEIMAYFDSTAALRRFDGLGGTNAIFFIKEKERIGTVNKVETKMMSALFKDGDIDRIFYFDSPKNDVYPLAQLKSVDRELKGFNWRPELRPRGRRDITSLEIRPSERKAYERHPKATFKQTDIYFPGYMKSVYKALEDAKARKDAAGSTGSKPGPATADGLPGGADKLQLPDSLAALADSLAPADSLRPAPDSLAADSLALADSLARADSLAAKPLTKAEIRAQQRAEAERKRAERIAAREARWDALDALDAEKAAAKAAKKEAREKAKLEKAAARQLKQDLADEAKLQKYIEKYRKRKAREDARAAAKAEKAAAKAARKAAVAEAAAPDSAADTLSVEASPQKGPKMLVTPAAEGGIPANSAENAGNPAANPELNPQTIDGTDTRSLPPLRSGGHPEQRGLREPALDPETAEPAQAPLQRAD